MSREGDSLSDTISKIIEESTMSDRLTKESLDKASAVLDEMLTENDGNPFDAEFLKEAKKHLNESLENAYLAAKMAVFVPTGVYGFSEGLTAPDMDISLLGIGKHRFFFFHSAIGLVILRKLYLNWLDPREEAANFPKRVLRKVTGVLLGSYAIGVGIHLAIDVFQPKAVIFPYFGSLVNGTMVDDNIWLMGNSLWAFKIGHSVFSLVLADDIRVAKRYVNKHFDRRTVDAIYARD